ncbi:MAG: DUF4185 domain-containing protein, partial [Gammaproteobacteria bacterium]
PLYGRFGPARLARVPAAALLDIAAYRYWTGQDWSRRPYRATPVIPAPIAELSVLLHHLSRRWLARPLPVPRTQPQRRLGALGQLYC